MYYIFRAVSFYIYVTGDAFTAASSRQAFTNGARSYRRGRGTLYFSGALIFGQIIYELDNGFHK